MENTQEIRLSSLITLSHILEKKDIGYLKIDDAFLRFILKILNQTIDNSSHRASINKTVPYYTHMESLVYFIGHLCQISENRNLIIKIGVTEQLARVSKMDTKKELLATLYLVDELSFAVYARKDLLKDQILLEKIEILKESHSTEIAEKAKMVYKHLYEIVIPDSVELDEERIQIYLNALKAGTTRARNARIIFLGHAGAGKTSLCRRFLGRSIEGVASTIGIDIFIHRFIWDLDSKAWILQKLGNEIETPTMKLAHIAKNCSAKDLTNITSMPDEHEETLVSTLVPRDIPSKDENDFHVDRTPVISYKMEEKVSDYDKEYHYENANPDIPSIDQTNAQSERIKSIFGRGEEMDIPDNAAFVSLWDFAGEEVFYATHHVFLSVDAIYLIVLDLSEIKSSAPLDKARYWLKSILTYSSLVRDEKGIGFWCPPIILIGTHKDKLPGETEEEKQKYANQRFKDVLDISDISGLDSSFIRYQFAIDNTIQDPTIKTLMETLIDISPDQLHWEKEVPSKWFILERELMVLKEKGQKFITEEELEGLDKQTESPIKDKEEIRLFLNYLHEEGILLYFPEIKEIHNYVFIDPQWVINAFKRIITTPDAVRQIQNHILRKRLDPLQKEGKLYEDYLKIVWSFDEQQNFLSEQSMLTKVMEVLNLIAKPLDTKQYWLVPNMLKFGNICEFLEMCDFDNKLVNRSCTLCLSINRRFVPDFIFDKLIAACLSKWVLCEKMGYPLLYRFMACFKVSQWKMVLFCNGNTVQSVLFNFSKQSKKIPKYSGLEVFEFLQNNMKVILNTRSVKDGWNVCFLCRPMLSTDARPLQMSELFQRGEIQCCEQKSVHIHHLTRDDLQQWMNIGINLPKSFGLPNKGNTSMDFQVQNLRYIPRGSISDKRQQGFKRSRDKTLTERDLGLIQTCCRSVGILVTPAGLGTVFRVGPCHVITSYHVIDPTVCIRTFQGIEMKEENLCSDQVYIKFSNDDNRFYLEPELLSFDQRLDYAILTIKLDGSHHIPPPFTDFEDVDDVQELTAIIGYGHPHHDDKIIETRVRLVSDDRVIEVNDQFQLYYSDVCKQILSQLGKDISKVDNAYTALLQEWVVPINCFMEKGASGAPGLVINGNKIKVVMMVNAGLPAFFWDLPEEFRTQLIHSKLRIEY